MKIELTKDQIDALIKIIDSTSFSGSAAQFVLDLKKALVTPTEPIEAEQENNSRNT